MHRSDLLQELASPAPKSHAPLRFTVGAGKPTPKESCTGQISCGSWLASDSGGKVRRVDRVNAIAGKPTPKESCAGQIYCRSRQAHSHRVMHRSDFLWELACQRLRRQGQVGRPGRCHRGQAHSHRWQVPLRFTAGAGKPTPIESCTGQISCGSWLASDSGGKVRWVDRVDAIAGKPAPTGGRCHSDLL